MANPIMKMEESRAEQERVIGANEVMTVNGSIQITAFLGIMVVLAASFVWNKFTLGYTDLVSAMTLGGAVLGFVLAMIVSFTRITYLIPVYAICEGFFLGGISAVSEHSYPGIVVQAVAGTFATLFSMLILYRTGLIRCSDKFRSVMFISTSSVLGVYLIDFVGRFFNYSVPLINESSNLGILLSVIVSIIAALNLIIDFDFIEQGAQRMYPKKYEWFGAFGLMVTLVWLYFEILRLLAKLNSRD